MSISEPIAKAIIYAQHRVLSAPADHVFPLDPINLGATNVFDGLKTHGETLKYLVMDIQQYVCLRKWHRDVLEVETNVGVLQQGVMGYLHGVPILATRDMLPNHWVLMPKDEANPIQVIKFEEPS